MSVLANEIWTEKNHEEYKEMVENDPDDFNRHWEHDNLVWLIRYDTDTTDDALKERNDIAPPIPSLSDYKLTFGVNKNLEITEEVKLVEAFVHD